MTAILVHVPVPGGPALGRWQPRTPWSLTSAYRALPMAWTKMKLACLSERRAPPRSWVTYDRSLVNESLGEPRATDTNYIGASRSAATGAARYREGTLLETVGSPCFLCFATKSLARLF